MLGFFPSPYNDELLYSVFARYHMRSGNKSFKGTIKDLFGDDTKIAVTDLTGNLKKICASTGNRHSPEHLLYNHTLFPYYSTFIPKERSTKVKSIMLSNNASNIHMLSGITASSIHFPRYLKFCIKCYTDELKRYGEAYWHRTHQLPGVYICPIHLVYLNESLIPFKVQESKQRFYALSEIDIGHLSSDDISTQTNCDLIFISKQTFDLLNQNIQSLNLEWLREFYKYQLGLKGFVTTSSRVRFRELLPAFITFYGNEFLNKMDSNLDQNDEDTWIHKMLRKPRVACHPLRHLLLIRFLGEDITSIRKQEGQKLEYLPFGIPPFQCLNKAAEHYLEKVVYEYEISRCGYTGKPIGTFKCNCGFVFTRRGPDVSCDDSLKIDSIKQFGHVWEDRVKDLYQKSGSIVQVANELGADRGTISKYLIKINNNIKEQKIESSTSFNKKNMYRNKWQEHTKIHPNLNRTDLRKLLPSVYTWLYRNDKEWLFSNLPAKEGPNKANPNRVDWKKRDDEIANLISLESEKIKNCESQIVRVTISQIGIRLGALSLLEKKLHKLPKCKTILSEVLETVEEFRARRVKIAAKKIRETDGDIQEWKLIREAGLRPDYGNLVLNTILQEISEDYSDYL